MVFKATFTANLLDNLSRKREKDVLYLANVAWPVLFNNKIKDMIMKVKATEKFQELGIENCYQRLETEIYYALRRGEKIEIDKIPEHLIAGKYVEIIKKKGE